MAISRLTVIPHPYHRTTRNDREQPETMEAESPATVGFRPVFPGQRAPQKWLITRRSRVQIPPPLPKAPVSAPLTGASTVLGGSSTGSSTGDAVWFLVEELLDGAGGFGLHAGEHVLVGVDGERRVPMAQPF